MRSYWDLDATGQSAAVGDGNAGDSEGLTTGEMTGTAAQEDMAELDFQGVWRVVPDGYPALGWQSP